MGADVHNWLVHRIHDSALSLALQQYARGILLDIGCGEQPYRAMTKDVVSQHFGLDHPESLHGKSRVDVLATAYESGLADDSVDSVLCTAVLEHLERPQDAIIEMYRILKAGGHVILSAPLFWHLHEEPRDFYRYTKYGLTYLFTSAGFEIVEIIPLSGYVTTFSQELVYFLNHLRRGLLRYPIMLMQTGIQVLAYWLNRWDRSSGFTWAYLVVAKKSAERCVRISQESSVYHAVQG
jgi:ubiquinone/menaquinone biosynthesis C-methylase UbiE